MEVLVLKLMRRHVVPFQVKLVRFYLVSKLPQHLIECWCHSLHFTIRSLPSSLLGLLNLAYYEHMHEQTVLTQELRVHR